MTVKESNDVAGLPSTWGMPGFKDVPVRVDSVPVQRLKAAGVPCDIEVVKGAFHGFDGIVPKAGVSQAFFNSQCAMLRRALAPAPA